MIVKRRATGASHVIKESKSRWRRWWAWECENSHTGYVSRLTDITDYGCQKCYEARGATDYTGIRFGNRTVLSFSHTTPAKDYKYNWRCDAGHTGTTTIKNLRKTECQSCYFQSRHVPPHLTRYKYRNALKQECIDAHGGHCNWEGCEISDPDMLTFDHINNDGKEWRKTYPGVVGSKLYHWLRNNDYGRGTFQLLCAGHNLKKEIVRKRRFP